MLSQERIDFLTTHLLHHGHYRAICEFYKAHPPAKDIFEEVWCSNEGGIIWILENHVQVRNLAITSRKVAELIDHNDFCTMEFCTLAFEVGSNSMIDIVVEHYPEFIKSSDAMPRLADVITINPRSFGDLIYYRSIVDRDVQFVLSRTSTNLLTRINRDRLEALASTSNIIYTETAQLLLSNGNPQLRPDLDKPTMIVEVSCDEYRRALSFFDFKPTEYNMRGKYVRLKGDVNPYPATLPYMSVSLCSITGTVVIGPDYLVTAF